MKNLNMLLFSSGQTERNKSFYHYCKDWLQKYVDLNLRNKSKILYISWATWNDNDIDSMFKHGQDQWGQFGINLIPLHKEPDYMKAILESDAIIVGGGSIHMLVRDLELNSLMIPLKDKINSGCIYIGTSAGAVITGPTMHTATEPPLIHIPSHKTLNIFPFQISPHYYDVESDIYHSGPPPQVRIKNYLSLNPDSKPVVCIKDGTFLELKNETLTVHGTNDVAVFDKRLKKHLFSPGSDLSALLSYRSKYYKTK